MFKEEVIITNETGLHARPASLFVKEASKFKSSVKVIKGDKECNAKSIMSVLSLGVMKGDTITILGEGDDAEDVVKALIKLVKDNFNE